MKVAIVGNGGREQAIAQAMLRFGNEVAFPLPQQIAGTSADLWVIGPEQPLVDGLADQLRARGQVVFGPGADGAMLEGSKAWMKYFLRDARVPTANFAVFDGIESLPEAADYLRSLRGVRKNGYVIKTDGLAAGKGVLVTRDIGEAINDARAKLSGEAFGAAGTKIVIEECLKGYELSAFAICNGDSAWLLPIAQDYKRLYDGDVGPNTGGMGSYAPVDVSSDLLDQINENILKPIMRNLKSRGIDYRGVLFLGLMVTADGPYVLEINVRFGDPETQSLFPLFASDPAELLYQAAQGQSMAPPYWAEQACVTLVVAANGYPENPRKDDLITGVGLPKFIEGVNVLQPGTKRLEDGRLFTSGGRVINIVATAPTVKEARDKVYQAVVKVEFSGMHFRRDIAENV